MLIAYTDVHCFRSLQVEIGAFRTFPEGYANNATASEWQSVPSDRIEDFGVHANCYYQLVTPFPAPSYITTSYTIASLPTIKPHPYSGLIPTSFLVP